MFKSCIFLYIVFILPSILYCSSQDDNAKSFFRGFISQGLRNPNWNDPIVDSVNANNFDVSDLIKAAKAFDTNSGGSSIRYESEAQILKTFINVLNVLFPIVSFSLRDGETVRNIPAKYQTIYNILEKNIEIYANDNIVAKLVQSSDFKFGLNPVSVQDYSAAGASFESLSEKLLAGINEISFQVDINLSNASKIIEEIYHAQQFVIGLLEGLGSGRSINEGLLIHINVSDFNASKILNDFEELSHISFNFTANEKDEEIFVETNGEISSHLRNLMLVAQKFGNQESVKQLSFVFNIFYNHNQLLESIKVAFKQNIDVRNYFKQMYVSGVIENNFKEAGRKFALVCSILNNKNRSFLE